VPSSAPQSTAASHPEDGHESAAKRPPVLQGRFPLQRFGMILTTLMEGPTTARKLAESMEVSAKTIQGDLEFLRDRLDFPIASDWKGVHLSEPIKGCPLCAILHPHKDSHAPTDREMIRRILSAL